MEVLSMAKPEAVTDATFEEEVLKSERFWWTFGQTGVSPAK
jgi:hypothetical protein